MRRPPVFFLHTSRPQARMSLSTGTLPPAGYNAACAVTAKTLTALKDEMWSDIAFPMVPWEPLTDSDKEAT